MTRQNGFAIRGFRQIAGISVTDMARIVDVSVAHYRKLEAETRDAQPEQLARIAKAVNVTVAALVRTPPSEPQAVTQKHTPFTDDGVTYCGWDGHEGCGEVWPCAAVRAGAAVSEPAVTMP